MISIKSISPYLRSIVFLLVAAMVFNVLTLVCKSASWTWDFSSYRNATGVKNIPTDEVDVIAIGSSIMRTGFSPMVMFDEYGIRAQNLAGSYGTMFSGYLLMQEVMRTHTVKLALLEMEPLFRPLHRADFRRVGDGLSFSSNKVVAVKNYSESVSAKDSNLSYILPLVKHHTAWKRLNKHSLQPFIQANYPDYYYGHHIFTRQTHPVKQLQALALARGWTDTGKQLQEPNAIQYDYLLKMIQLCREKNIPLILFRAPAYNWSPAMHNTVQKLANEMDLPFIDFHMQNVFTDSAYDLATDMNDGHHPNRFGAEKISRYLGRYLRDNFDLPDRRGDPDYAYMNDDLIRYKREMFFLDFALENNMSRYLDLLGSRDIQNYTVIFSVRDNSHGKMGDEILGKLRALGFVSDKVFKEARHSFIGIWQDGKVIYEAESETIDKPDTDALEYRSVLPDGMKYYVKSAGALSGNVSRIIINGVEYSKNSRGFNVVVYDNATGRVIDSINWDTWLDAGITFKR